MTETPSTSTPKPLYRIDFDKAHQIYKRDGKRVPGVTTILNMMAKPALIGWANRMGLEGIDTTKYVDRAANIGTVTHARIEAHLKDMDLDESNLSPEMIDKSANGFLRFLEWWDQQRLTLVASEKQMVSERFNAGGTLDIVARPADESEPERHTLVDIKSGTGIYKEMRIQTSAYAAMYEECTGISISRVFIVRTGKEENDTLEVAEVTNRVECVKAFELMAELYPIWSKLK